MEDSYHLGHRAPHIYIRERCCVVGGVKKESSKLHSALARGHHLPSFLKFLPAQHVKYRYYVFIIMRSQALRSADRERPRRSAPSWPSAVVAWATGREARPARDNQFITAGASAHLHTRGRRRVVVYLACRRSFRILQRAVIRAGTNCRAETRCKFTFDRSTRSIISRHSIVADYLGKVPSTRGSAFFDIHA